MFVVCLCRTVSYPRNYKFIMSFSTPAEIVAQAEQAALNKISLSFPRTLVAAMLAGIYIAMGGLLSLLIGSDFPNGQQEIRESAWHYYR